MGYLHIDNLYKNQDILLFKQCYAMEKIHGTSAHILWKGGNIIFFSGGVKHNDFIQLFDVEFLKDKFIESFIDNDVCIYGEAYGGKCQKMSATYGANLKFVAFDIKIRGAWLDVPSAEKITKRMGLEFVHYKEIPTDIELIDAERDADSVQAIRNGMGTGKMREGVVLRPLKEVITNNGERIIAKHRRHEFSETKTPRNITDKLVLETNIKNIIDEWVTKARLNHILTRGTVELCFENISKIIALMIEDVIREGAGELQDSPELRKAIGRQTALMVKQLITVMQRDGKNG